MSAASPESSCGEGIMQDTTVAVILFMLGYVLFLPRWRVAERLARFTHDASELCLWDTPSPAVSNRTKIINGAVAVSAWTQPPAQW
mmetsp:Transcript_127408/g.354656  ORF Transcript_127408/g.354656 Transcript_127408/m.354656 type:complete len:86 (+) Transcript_127408:160-417(+)